MITYYKKYSQQTICLVCLFVLLLITSSTEAQQAVSATRAVKAEPAKQTVRIQKHRAPTLSKEMQKSLVEDELAAIVVLCGTACRSDPAGTISTSRSTRDYTCNGGNCACAGAADCVAMKPICQDDTIGCNDYGCTCKEGEADDG